jgi:hypothetical protein
VDSVPAEETAEVVRPDWTSAVVTARAQGVPVEVLSERTETTRVLVGPDGAVTEETAFAAVRFEDESAEDGWRDIDTTLVAGAKGEIRPAAMPVDVRLGTGAEELIIFDRGSVSEVGLGVDGIELPEPVLEGATALYEEVLPGVDLSVEVRSAGFEALWVVKTPEAAVALVEQFGNEDGEMVLPTSLRSTEAKDGAVTFEGPTEEKGWFSTPTAWDSSSETPDERGAVTEIEFQLDAKADTSRKAERGKARGMGIATPVDWMTDDERVFPVVIDPTYASASGGPVFDAFVQEGYTSDQSGAAELKLGDNGSGQVARSYLNFNASLFKDRTIISAELSLYESWSWSCTAKTFTSYDSGLASTSTRWTSQPTIGTKRASLSVAKGYNSSCPAGTVKLDMTAQAKAWSSTTASKVGMMLRASSETDSLYWKRFHSSEGTNKPVLKVTYNRAPNTPVAPTVAGIMTVDSKKFVGAARPALSVAVKDSDADVLKVQFARFTSATSTSSPTTVCEKTSVASGGTASCTPTADLPANSKLWLRARVHDGREWSAWGAAVEVTTSRATPLATRRRRRRHRHRLSTASTVGRGRR